MADAEKKEITIQGVVVAVSAPYAEGHQITAAEAKALNQVRAENIRNNMAKKVKKAAEGGADAKAIQALVDQYDAEYEFTLASVGGGGKTLDPLTKEARSIARAYISKLLKEQGITQKAYKEQHGEDSIEQKIAELSENEQIIKLAKENLKKREAVTVDVSL